MTALDPHARKLLDLLAASGQPPLETLPVEQARQAMSAAVKLLRAPPVAVAETRELSLPGPAGELRARLYRPAGTEAGALLPGCVFFHGGGFVVGSLDDYDNVCCTLADASGCVVVSIDYRLAPEAAFPAAPEDCYAATRWVAAQAASLGVDAQRLAVAGDSAGANLAAVVCLMAREAGGPALRHQLLIYPVSDLRGETESVKANAEGYFLTEAMMRWFLSQYISETEIGDWRASPLLAGSHAGLPSASILVCGYDPLHDDGVAYAEALKRAGVPVKLTSAPDQIHGLMNFDGALPASRPTLTALAGELRVALG